MSVFAGDRVTIDLHGIGGAVRSAAAGRGLTIAAFAREALVSALSEAPPLREMPDAPAPRLHGTVKLPWRMDVGAAEALAANPRALGLSYGQYVGYLVSAAPLPAPLSQRVADQTALRASTDHLAKCCAWPARTGQRLNKELLMTSIKNMVGGDKQLTFVRYRDRELWYVTDDGFEFPVPVADIGNATFLARDKALLLMRYTHQHLALLEQARRG